jgi:hypothetical protein
MSRRKRGKREQEKPESQVKKPTSEKDTQPAKVEGHPPLDKRYFLRTMSMAKVFWSAIAVGLSLLGGWSVIRPVVRVQPYIQLDPSSPFSERFELSNDGLFAIHDVESSCQVIYANTVNHQWVKDVTFPSHRSYSKTIEAADSTSIDCPVSTFVNVGQSQYVEARIEFKLEFTPSWYLWKKTKTVLFDGQLDSQGSVKWIY